MLEKSNILTCFICITFFLLCWDHETSKWNWRLIKTANCNRFRAIEEYVWSRFEAVWVYQILIQARERFFPRVDHLLDFSIILPWIKMQTAKGLLDRYEDLSFRYIINPATAYMVNRIVRPLQIQLSEFSTAKKWSPKDKGRYHSCEATQQ